MKTNKKRSKSLKGKWGHVGAPPKATKFPKTPFTMAVLFGKNKNQCQLSLRNKVDALLSAGKLIALKTRKQKGGAVGRPKAVFILKDSFKADKHTKLDANKVKAPKVKTLKVKTPKVKAIKRTRSVITVTSAAPASAPVVPVAAHPQVVVVTPPPTATLAPATAPASPLTTLKEIKTESEVTAPAAPAPAPVETAVSVAPASPAAAPAAPSIA